MFQPGDYVCVDVTPKLFTTRWIVDSAIKLFTHSKFCHAFIVTDTNGEIVEAHAGPGVHVSNISEYSGMMMLGSKDNLSPAQRAGIVKSAYSLVGRDSYGFLDIVNLGLYCSGISWNWLISEVQEETHRTICSQLVAMCGAANGVTQWLCGKEYASLVTPADLANYAL